MSDIHAVQAYRERLLDLVVNRSDVRMDGAVQYVPRGKETLEIFDAALAELKAERDAAVRERDIWRDMYRHSVRPVCGSEMAYEAQMKYDREASRARLYTKQRREETWADSPPIETEDGYV